MSSTTAPKTPGGKWRPGQSGNPSGRPSNAASLTAMRAELAEHLPGAIATIAALAKSGDVAACRVIIERCLPPLKPAELAPPVDLTGCTTHAERVSTVMAASDRGEITSAQLVALLDALKHAEAALIEASRPLSILERMERTRPRRS